MGQDPCMLTARDRYVLERLRGSRPPLTEAWRTLLEQKLSEGRLPPSGVAPPDLATIDARVSFRCASGLTDVRTLCLPGAYTPAGAFLPITTFYGLALLGLREGQSLAIGRPEGRRDWIMLEKVLFQPRAADRTASASAPALARVARPLLRLVVGGLNVRPPAAANENGSGEPGPPAA